MKQKFTYLLSLMLMCIFGVSNAVASSESDLATISANHTVIFAGIMNEAKLEKGKLYDNNYILSKDGNNYANNKKTNSVLNALNCCRIKSASQDRLVFKVSESCTLIIYGETREDRLPFLNTDGSSTASINGEFDKDKGTSTFIIPAAGTYYIVGNGDRFLAGLQFTFAAKVPPTIGTDLPATKTVLRDETVVLSPSINDGITYQWYKCNDANKTGATAITGANAPSYSFKATSPSTSYYYCVGSNNYGEVSTSVCAVTVENAKAISRTWDFTKGSTWDAGVKAATTIWGKPTSNRYYYLNAITEEELKDNDGVLAGLGGIYFTAQAEKLLLGVKSAGDNSSCLQFQGACKMIIPNCYKGDKIYFRFCASGDNKTVSITSDKLVEGASVSNTSRTSNATVEVKEAGNLVLNVSGSVRLYEVKVSSKYYFVTSFDLSADKVSVEEFDNVSVSAKNFAPANYSDGTINWTSSDESVATVNNGVITGVKEGKATITATSVDGPSKTVAVTVTPSAPKNLSIEMTSNSDVAAPKVESGKTYTLTAKVQGYGLTYQWASKATEKGSYANISGATAQTYEATAVELGSKFYKVTVTNAQGSAVAEYEVKTVAPLEAFTIANEDGTGGINYKALDADEPQVKVCYQLTKADQEIDLFIPDSVEYAGLTYAVTTVGEEAFVNDNTIESLTTTPVLKEIGARAFMFCINLEEVNLADGIETIGDAAFFGCNAFTSFNIPGSVKYVGYKAFAECAALTDIYYDGTKAEWDALPNIGMAGIAKSVTIHFNDGETENGKGNIVGISNANADEAQKDGKFVENGQIVIYKNGKKYNAAGAEIK